MQEKGAIALTFMIMTTVATGYLLFGRIGILAGPVTAGSLYAAFFLVRSWRLLESGGNTIGTRIRFNPEFMDGVWGRQQRRDAQEAERKAYLEVLRTKAHRLVNASQDIYGAQRYCLEIIGQTEKEDPLFIEACDLYMRTVTDRPRRGRDSAPPGFLSLHPIGSRPEPARAKVIPFPRAALRE